jgi:hypothetical protein
VASWYGPRFEGPRAPVVSRSTRKPWLCLPLRSYRLSRPAEDRGALATGALVVPGSTLERRLELAAAEPAASEEDPEPIEERSVS